MSIPNCAGCFASVSVLRLLSTHGANFAHNNAIYHAAEREQQVEVLQWLLDEGGVHINQREF